MKKNLFLLAMIVLSISANTFGQGTVQDDIALIKTNLTISKESIKKYEWIETITTFMNGEQKSVKQNQCYYDVTGTLVKVPTGATTQAKELPGLRGRIQENKKQEIGDYVERAITKIKTYIPPVAEKIQQIYGAGNVAIHILEPGKKFKLDFPGYNQPGDMVSIAVDRANKVLMGYSVNTTVDSATDAVSADITFQTLPDGTSYPGNTTFNSVSQNLKIVIVNSGYKLGAGH